MIWIVSSSMMLIVAIIIGLIVVYKYKYSPTPTPAPDSDSPTPTPDDDGNSPTPCQDAGDCTTEGNLYYNSKKKFNCNSNVCRKSCGYDFGEWSGWDVCEKDEYCQRDTEDGQWMCLPDPPDGSITQYQWGNYPICKDNKNCKSGNCAKDLITRNELTPPLEPTLGLCKPTDFISSELPGVDCNEIPKEWGDNYESILYNEEDEGSRRCYKTVPCKCDNGEADTTKTCIEMPNTSSLGRERACKSCDTGYHLYGTETYEYTKGNLTNSCIMNYCLCENGTPTQGAECPKKHDNKCSSCNTGYKLNEDNTKCEQAFTYSCPHGTPANNLGNSDIPTPTEKDQIGCNPTAPCDEGYYHKGITDQCDPGTACENDPETGFKKCTSAYLLSNGRCNYTLSECAPTTCKCENGTPKTGTECKYQTGQNPGQGIWTNTINYGHNSLDAKLATYGGSLNIDGKRHNSQCALDVPNDDCASCDPGYELRDEWVQNLNKPSSSCNGSCECNQVYNEESNKWYKFKRCVKST